MLLLLLLSLNKQEYKPVLLNSLKNFSGVSRRFEEKGTVQINGKEVLVVDDYGHHPQK